MMLASLPAPTRDYAPPQAPVSASTAIVSQTRKEPPPYGSQERARYVPRRQEDFGDGGAFPEVQVAQFPLDMGKKGQQSGVGSSSGRDTTLAVTVNAEGDVNYDSILRQGRNKDKIIYSDHKSLVPKVDALREVTYLPVMVCASLQIFLDRSKLRILVPATLHSEWQRLYGDLQSLYNHFCASSASRDS